ncbi:RNA polymerase sigma-70 factor (family 1) [Parabacteroides sp. PFB2-12]|uniref:RNA polymerase sigma-70 factor n=1 Tax=unclassified Parabacteroides TaxID=2649774 RepID=UPI00247509FB|nr:MULTISPECIES: RNA polymerase sigma-70 factor [unclassified Parabacteroides]MDH6341373.1 RNA polymerase sigma-70 factor (family 1) [Parabacteroides sp. PM6-13]MDH6389167.1 RNA polymerase sigma-70 factor (family 1) [Parabacteroides sp. PFB2-12]
MTTKETDTTILLERIAAGDHDSFRLFYDRYYLQVYRFASYLVDSPLLIEEIVSDVFCIIWENRKKLATIDHFEAYLYTITKNKALYYLRMENKVFLTELESVYEQLSHEETPEQLAVDEELSLSLKEAIDELPERCRLIFLMAREEGLKYREIATILSISEKTVNAQMVLAIKKLTKRLGNIVLFIF